MSICCGVVQEQAIVGHISIEKWSWSFVSSNELPVFLKLIKDQICNTDLKYIKDKITNTYLKYKR